MSEAIVRSKGQITIPVDVRNALALHAGERVVFTILDDGTVIMRAKNRSVLELEGMLEDKNQRKTKVKIKDMNLGRANISNLESPC